MSNNSRSGNNEFSPDVLKSFVEVQKKKIENEGKELSIKEKEIASNERLAMKSMELHADILKQRPNEMRKNITRLFYIGISILVVVIVFVCWLLSTNNKDFAILVIDKSAYVLVAVISYTVGKKSGKSSKDKDSQNDDIQDSD